MALMDFLEKAGLVTKDAPMPAGDAPQNPDFSLGEVAPQALPVSVAGDSINLDEIYSGEGVGPSAYPAERLLRLIDGLKAMDEPTRKMAIAAMDAADESWSINDPLSDAAAKVQALTRYAERLQQSLRQVESETQIRLDAVAARREQVVGDILKQIADLEALASREKERAERESAEQQTSLKAMQDQTAAQIAQLNATIQQFQALTVQFGSATTSSQE